MRDLRYHGQVKCPNLIPTDTKGRKQVPSTKLPSNFKSRLNSGVSIPHALIYPCANILCADSGQFQHITELHPPNLSWFSSSKPVKELS